MLMRTGLYPDNSAAQGQVLRLSRYRAARIGADVNLHTGKWTFEQAVNYFMEAGGLDRESATGEAAGAAGKTPPKITLIGGNRQNIWVPWENCDKTGAKIFLGPLY